MKITILKKGKKFLESLSQNERERIARAIFALPNGDIKAIKGTNDGFRLRVGKWRIVYQTTVDEFIIRDIGSRGDIYK
ncbi:MAG: type II toxin-antitoxin system RelE/ParE family toxin [Oscillospiraceae bacterium]|nr:type II toxin-antitoxin system RelE/ParE family toxin [Oscillospiraceae bacterium]